MLQVRHNFFFNETTVHERKCTFHFFVIVSAAAEVADTAFSTGHGWAEYTKFVCTGKEGSLAECNYTLSESCLSYDPYTGDVSVAQLVCSGDPAPGNL